MTRSISCRRKISPVSATETGSAIIQGASSTRDVSVLWLRLSANSIQGVASTASQVQNTTPPRAARNESAKNARAAVLQKARQDRDPHMRGAQGDQRLPDD